MNRIDLEMQNHELRRVQMELDAARDEHEILAKLIQLADTQDDFREYISALTATIQDWSGCEAIGIRLRAGDDYPYYETHGFPPEFVQAEKYLCAYDQHGQIILDGTGNPVLECMCGNILCRRFDPAKPFFTPHGSFWTNSTTALLASTTEADRQARTRNRCNGEGYESVALIPLHCGNQIFGLLQFNDHRPDRFTTDRIAGLERIADNLAIALSRRQTIEALKESEDRFRSSIMDTDAGYFFIDKNGIIRNVNQAWVKLYKYSSAEEIIGQHFTVIQKIDDVEKAKEFVEGIMHGNPDYLTGEFSRRCKDGSIGFHTFSARPVISLQKVIGIEGFIIDTSERRQSEEKLQKVQLQIQKAESLGRMAGAIAHHFNNQLAVVIGNLEIALDDLPQNNVSADNLTEAMTAARKATEVSSLMLTYLGQTVTSRESMDICETCRLILPLLQAAHPKKITMEVNFPSPGPVIIGNKNQIQQILKNLVTNAWESINHNGEGSIRLCIRKVHAMDIPALQRFPLDWQPEDRTYACLEVTDTGCGIPDKDIENLFDPFFSSKFTGRGLGLPVVLGIVRSHNGAITVSSAPGQGSIFCVFFPVSEQAVPSSPEKESKIPAIEGANTVLLVEDEASVCKMVTAMLKTLGMTVLEGKDGAEAVEVFRRHKDEIRFVICDLTMPRMNGLETITALRDITPGIPVILASGYDEGQVMEDCPSEKPDAFLHKPFSKEDLEDKVRKALNRK